MAKILLSEWASRNGVRPRTASSWASKGRIKAAKGELKVVFTQEKTVHGYLIDENAKVPSFDESKQVARQPEQEYGSAMPYLVAFLSCFTLTVGILILGGVWGQL